MKSYLQEIIKRKDLLFYLVKSGLKAEHRNSYLGYLWWLLDPLLNVVIYYFLVVVVLNRGGEDFPVYLVIGLVTWRFTNSSIRASAKAITKYASIINQVYLPKAIFPFAVSLTQVFNFMFGLVVIGIFLIAFQVIISWQAIYLPVIILVHLLFLLAVTMVISFFCVFIRDIDNLISHILRIFFYTSPIIWESRNLPSQIAWLAKANPIAILVTSYRDVLMYQSSPNWLGLILITILSLLMIFWMLKYYQVNEHKIIKAL
ncbi:lipopolysaccharide transport system permease protein/teichoic acid transport system permease protein [Natronobacillus azotifigens]|uniref:Transport permease protein n=1 Tax=Natronobacillus azotifigens TaxID=472978 RepID=A0A9J6RDZ2_9BACI|nr:ABC transporter permease [Natronobacillus azotifigens]MCZ0703685.1 ABC transporter permease [Natronobacillus azotifigens]